MPRPHGFRLTTYSRPRIASWPSADLLGLAQRLAQHDERLLGEVVGGHDIIGLLEIERVDLVGVDELDELERLLALELDRLDLLVVEQDVVALRHSIALDDLVAVDRADAGDDLLVFDPLAVGSWIWWNWIWAPLLVAE